MFPKLRPHHGLPRVGPRGKVIENGAMAATRKIGPWAPVMTMQHVVPQVMNAKLVQISVRFYDGL